MALYFYVALALIATCHAEPGQDSNATPGSPLHDACKIRNSYHAIDGECDTYIQCKGFHASTETCPDGLHFNPDAKWPEYPCGYAVDIPCAGKKAQPAQPSGQCPHKYGYFPSPASSKSECGHYTQCVDGRAIDMECPVGLAFNPVTSRCDWPDKVASCNPEEFLGFSCPPAPVDEDGEVEEGPINYKYPGECYYFFSCEDGHPRVLSCDAGYAFNPEVGKCEEEDYFKCEYPKA